MSNRIASLSLHMTVALLVAGSLAVRQATAEGTAEVRDGAAVPLGLVTSTSAVEVDPDELHSPVSTFAYFSGQRIVTPSETRLVLTLQDGSVELGPESAVVVTGEPGDYRLRLEKGAARIRFGASAELEVAAGTVLLRRGARGSDEILEATLQLHESGDLDVASQRGLLEAVGGTEVAALVVEPGAPLPLADVAADSEEPGLLVRAAYAAGGLAVFGGAAALAVGLSDDDDDDPDASPTN